MTNTQIHPVKRVITFIMALLMVLSSFVYFGTPVDAVTTAANFWFYIGDSGVTTSFESKNWNIASGWAAAALFCDDQSMSVYDMFNISGITVGITGMYDVFDRINRTGYNFDTLWCKEFSVDGGLSKIDTKSFLGEYKYWVEDDVKNGVTTFNSADNVIWYFYPQWKVNTYTITYHSSRDASAATKTQTFEYGVRENLEANTFTAPAGKVFSHWENTGGNVTYTDGQAVQSLTPTNNANINLYAVWADKQYNLTLNAGEGAFSDGSKTKTYQISYGQTYKSAFGNSFPTPILRGYTFDYYDYNNGQYGLDSSKWEDEYGLNFDGTMYAKYLPNDPFTLTFNDWGSTTSVNFLQGQQIRDFTTLPSPTRDGYNFVGWFTAESGGTQVTNTYAPDGNTTIYAQWQGKEQTLVLDAIASIESPAEIQGKKRGTFSDGSTSMSVTIRTGQKYDDVDALTPMPCPTMRGYSFYGWYFNGGTYKLNADYDWEDKPYTPSTGATFTATYKANDPYVLQFDAVTNGGTLSGTTEYEFLSGMYISDVVSSLPTPASRESEGLRFKGWYTAATGGNKITNLNTELTQNTTYYAQWEKIPYILTLNPNGGSFTDGTTANKTYEIHNGELYKDVNGLDPMPIPVRAGYDFLGWGIGDDELNTPRYNAPDWKDDDSFESTQNLTFYAVWDLHTYTITFDPNGGTMPSGYTTDPYPIKFKASISDAVGGYPIPTKEGYTFEGWIAYKDTDYEFFWAKENQWSAYPNFELYSDAVMVAKWKKTPYTLTFDPNGGDLSKTEYTIHYGDRYTDVIGAKVPKPVWTSSPREYRFDGWTLTKNGSDIFWWPDKADNWENSTYSKEGNSTVYAKWTKLDRYYLTFDLNDEKTGRAYMPSGFKYLKYTFYDGELLETVFKYNTGTDVSFPIPIRPGYTFVEWELDVNDIEKWSTAWGENQPYSWKQDVTMTAKWSRNDTYKVTFDLNGGTLDTNNLYKLKTDTNGNYYVEMATGEYFDDVIGGFPKPELTNMKFLGWKYVDDNGIEYLWKNSWDPNIGAQYGLSKDGTFVAQWGILTNTITFHATGTGCARIDYNYYKMDSYNDPVWFPTAITAPGAKVNGEDSYLIEIAVNEYFNAIGDYPVPEYEGYTFQYWYGTYYLGDELKQVKITRRMWENDAFDKGVDLELYAYYTCNHSAGLTWHYSDDTITHTDPLTPYFYKTGANPWDDGSKSHAGFFRHHGVCETCSKLAAFGYNVHFLARNNGMYVIGGDILLSSGVPLEDLFTIKNGGYNERGFVIDYLWDGLDPEITIHYDPLIKAANREKANGFSGWIVDYTKFGYRQSPNFYNFALPSDAETGVFTWKFNYKDQSFGDYQLHSCHLRLAANYDSGYYEMVFNAGVGLDPNVLVSGAGFVDSGNKYGVLPIKKGDFYMDLMDYVPTAKHVASYPDPKVYNGYSGSQITYSRAEKTLYCSISWKYGSDYLDSKAYASNSSYPYSQDVMLTANYISKVNEETSDGIAQGSLATVYANNKKASAAYNKAYFDPNENSGGTMYYMYTKESGSWKCYPLFDYNPVADYKDALKCYPSENPATDNQRYGSTKEKYFQIEDDFKYTDYKDLGFDIIIAKEPKRYTYYMGDDAYYVFPTPVNTPDGQSYQAYSGDPKGPTGIWNVDGTNVTKDPQIMDKYVASDKNGNSYFLDVNDNKGNVSNFRMARCIFDYPVVSQFTAHTTMQSFTNNSPFTTMPLGFCAMQKNCKVHNELVGTTNRPYGGPGGSGHVYLPAEGYEDYNLTYGSGLRLYYPEGDNVTLFNLNVTNADNTEVVEQNVDMQAAYYTSWEFMIKFTSNFPTDKSATGIGLPYALDSGTSSSLTTADGTPVSSSSIKADNNGNYTVYQYAGFWSSSLMPNRKLFTCDGYYIDEWQLFDKNGNPVKGDDGNFIKVKALDKATYDGMRDSDKEPYSFSGSDAYLYAREPGAEFRAVWKKAVTFTAVEGGSGNDPFTVVNYMDVYTGADQTFKPNETGTVMVKENSVVSIGSFAPASGNEYAYLTLNNNSAPLVADRIITNAPAYSFRIVSDTAMTVQFVPTGTTRGFYIDRNNKLLNSNADPWRLYTKLPTRTPAGVADDSKLNNALYYMYSNNTGTYDITVASSTYSAMNTTHKDIPYDDVLTIMTGPKNASGAEFVGWQIGSQFVSYDLVYKHRVTSTETVTAVYANSEIANVSIVEKGNDGNVRDFFVSQYILPKSCTLIETGFIVTKTNDSTITFDDLYKADGTTNTAYRKIVSTNADPSGTFKLLVPESGTHYVVAYVYYREDNKTKVIYSARSNQ